MRGETGIEEAVAAVRVTITEAEPATLPLGIATRCVGGAVLSLDVLGRCGCAPLTSTVCSGVGKTCEEITSAPLTVIS